MHEECFPEGTQTAISADGQYEIYERAVLLPFQVDTARLSIAQTSQGYRVTAPTLVIEDRSAMDSIAAHQSEEEEEEEEIQTFELDSGEENKLHLDDFDFSMPDLCPTYHPLQVSPWRMMLAGFQVVVAFPGVDPEDFQVTVHAGANRLSVRTSRPVPKEGRLCLPITTQISADGSQELVDIAILMPQGCGDAYTSEDFEHGVKITVPFLGSPLPAGFGLSLAPSLDPPRKLTAILDDALRLAEEKPVMEEHFSSLVAEANETVEEQASSSTQGCPEYEGMSSRDWQIDDGFFVLDVTMPGVLPEMRKVEFTEDGLLRVAGFRSLSPENLQCLPLQALTTVSVAHGLQEMLGMQVALPLGGDAARVEQLMTRLGLRLRMPIVVGGAEAIKVHEA